MGLRARHVAVENRKIMQSRRSNPGLPARRPSLYPLSNPNSTMSEVYREIFAFYSDNYTKHVKFEQSILMLNFVVYMH
jgi:hypothetical protein